MFAKAVLCEDVNDIEKNKVMPEILMLDTKKFYSWSITSWPNSEAGKVKT